MKDIIYNNEKIIKIGYSDIEKIKRAAKKSPRKRARICLHRDMWSSVQEMIIALHRDTYIRPHKHPGKSESFHIIEGILRLFIFDNNGKIKESFLLGNKDKNGKFIYRAVKGLWHMPVPVTDIVVFHEVTKGPFKGEKDSVFPKWAPENNQSMEIKKYLERLMKCYE